MNGIKKSCRGFSLVELMVAALAFSILVLLTGSMLIFGWRGWKQANENVNMQQDASLAMTMISKEIRNATSGEITVAAGVISFGGSGASFTESGNDLVLDDGMKVIRGCLDTGTFKTRKDQGTDAEGKTNQWVQVDFDLTTTTQTESYSIKVSPRNGP